MKFLFLHGAIKNAGDFLISHRSQTLIKYIIPDITLIPVWEGTDLNTIRHILKSGVGG